MLTVKEAEKLFKMEWVTVATDKDDPDAGLLDIEIDTNKIKTQEDFDTFMYAFRRELGEAYLGKE